MGREKERGIENFVVFMHSRDQYWQIELLRMSCDNDTGKMQKLIIMFALSRVAWADFLFNLVIASHCTSTSVVLV